MGYNTKVLKADPLDKKKLSKPKDVIYSPEGQWKYPGQVTKIPGNDITMKGVNYLVLGVDNNNNKQMMMPGMEYHFPGAETVTEYPQLHKMSDGTMMANDEMGKGGWLDQYDEEFKSGGTHRKLVRGESHKNIKTSINKLFLRNQDLFGQSGRNSFVPYLDNHKGWLDKYDK